MFGTYRITYYAMHVTCLDISFSESPKDDIPLLITSFFLIQYSVYGERYRNVYEKGGSLHQFSFHKVFTQ